MTPARRLLQRWMMGIAVFTRSMLRHTQQCRRVSRRRCVAALRVLFRSDRKAGNRSIRRRSGVHRRLKPPARESSRSVVSSCQSLGTDGRGAAGADKKLTATVASEAMHPGSSIPRAFPMPSDAKSIGPPWSTSILLSSGSAHSPSGQWLFRRPSVHRHPGRFSQRRNWS